eukprot:CAMPEP_0180385536 /NCGR_PEP_ID=MMETSP0989-20121125/29158_1 /TAXON_ID=697907 /ORGANISM="non described non described, Strain CCMP2293" /LENGTH=138 /DNA_ID=CAMNT_0022386139 /DNA_START=193 /DNA_END=607 /DNA_ORIENTATION=+
MISTESNYDFIRVDESDELDHLWGGAAVSFNMVSTESCCDFIRVDESNDADFTSGVTQLASFSGSSAGQQYQSTKRYLRIHFTTDGSVTNSGFVATWGSSWSTNNDSPPECSPCEVDTYKNTTDTGCNACPSNAVSAE